MAMVKSNGASDWVTVGSNIALTAGTPVQISASSLADLLAATEEDYAFFEARLQVVSGGATANSKARVFLRPSDGTNQQPAPSSVYRQKFLGAIVLDGSASGYYYHDQLENLNKEGTLYIESSDDAITVTLEIRAWTWKDQ